MYIQYDAKEKAEIERIKAKYTSLDSTPSTLSEMKRIDRRVESVSRSIAICWGIIGLLVLGTSLSMVLALGSGILSSMVVGIIGISMMVFTKNIYDLVLFNKRKKYKSKIISISEK